MFAAATHVPVEMFRMACAVGMGVSLSAAFVIQASRERQELARRREEFISVVAHDLRNPISAISLGADLLDQQLESTAWNELDQRSAQKFVATIKRSAHGLERMVEDLLDASRIETRMLALERSAVDLRPLVNDIVSRVRQQMRGHSVRLLMPDKVPQVHADPMRVEQIVINLLSNAAKYSTAGTEITIEAKVLSTEVELAVTNEGAGLTEDETGQVFTRFYRSKAQIGKVEGLGIGLYIAKGLVEAQGGHIWVDSEPGKCTTFHFTLVRSDVSPELVNVEARPGSPRIANLATHAPR
jgi:signal transduction histidine kinase